MENISHSNTSQTLNDPNKHVGYFECWSIPQYFNFTDYGTTLPNQIEIPHNVTSDQH
jgi:hypothetical protein